MGRTYDGISDAIAAFLESQPVFFVATAPRGDDAHVNLSPKGVSGTFAVIDARTVAYLDLTGSGVETIAHVRENGRITLMFCAFDGPPRIVRVYGRGHVVVPGQDEYADGRRWFGGFAGVRAIIAVTVDRVADSCGYAVPRMNLVAERDQLWESFTRK